MAWYVEKMPEEYKGAYMLRRGLGLSRLLLTGDVEYPNVERVDDASSAPLNTDGRDAFAMRFTAVDDGSSGVFLDYLQGITGPAEPPGSSGGVDNGRVWDFRKCEEGGAGEWQVVEARATCAPGRGLVMRPGGNDPKLVGPATDLRSQEGSARFLKLRVAASYVADGGSAPHLSEWFWASPGHGFDPEHSRNLTLKQDGTTHVYWTVVPLANAGGEVGRLRFDPVDGPVEATVEWIAADLVR
jgi:hypothetical protein